VSVFEQTMFARPQSLDCSGMKLIAEVLDAVMNSRVVGRTVGDLGSHIMCDDACRCRRLELLRRSS